MSVTGDMMDELLERTLKAEAECARLHERYVDCSQDDVCIHPPGCARHWEERNRELVADVNRLRKIFDDAGQGEHNVLALVDHYQQAAADAEAKIKAIKARVLIAYCVCFNECPECGHEDDQGECLSCEIDGILEGRTP